MRELTSPPGAGGAPAGRQHLGLALVVISMAQLMVVLDASIVNVALPSIQRSLGFSEANLVWVINGYTLAFGGLLLLGGRTGDLFGKRKMFVIGIGLFAAASLLGGLATTEWWLIGARVLQGMGGAIASPTALSLIASTFAEGHERNRAMGVYAAMSGAGGAVGVLLGGVLTDWFSWRWVFFVNVPIGLFVALAAPRVFGETETRAGRLDLPGALLATSGMSLLVFGLIHAASTAWSDRWTVFSLVAGGVLLVAFVLVEARSSQALMPLRLFKNRNRSAGYAIMLAIGTAMFAMFYFLTLFIQDVLGYSPLKAGLSYLPFALMIMVSATFTSRIVGRTGPRVPLMAGTLAGTAGLLLFSTMGPHTTYFPGLLVPMLLVAGGVAMCFVPLTLTSVSGVGPHEQGIASALLNSGQQVGGSLGLAVLGTIAITATTGALRAAGSAAARFIGGAPPPRSVPVPAAVREAVGLAYVHGYSTALRLGAVIVFFAFLLAAFVMRALPAPAGAPEAAPHPG